MKRSGAIQLCCIILLVSAIIIVSPVSAQLYDASQKNLPLTGLDKEFADSRTMFDETKPVRNINYHSLLGFSVAPSENVAKSGDVFLKPGSINTSFTTEANKSNNEEDINFRTTSFIYPAHSRSDVGVAEYPTELLLMYAKALKQYAKKNGFDTCYAFLSNMGMLCDKKRFFVINLTTMQIEQSGLVSHGRGQGPTIFDKQYSDGTGSRCTSLGRYKILGKYNGKYGEAYKMSGLDSSNHNAYDRNIVLHSMNCIPDVENRYPACVSDGCPAVSSKFLSSLGKVIETRKKPLLLWIFDSNLEEPVIEETYIDPIRIDHSPVAISPFATSKAIHTNEKLRAVVQELPRQNKFVHWVSKKGNQISKFGNKVKKQFCKLTKK